MNVLDSAVLGWANQFAQRWYALDFTMSHVVSLSLVKGTPFVLALTWLWFTKGESRTRRRELVIATVLAGICAIAVGRLLAIALPYRPRPLARPDLHFVVPWTFSVDHLRTWSAFPSDHALLFSTLATGLWFASPALGAAAHLYSALVVWTPRVFLGLHHPTDVLGGAALGVAVGMAACLPPVRRRLAAWPLRLAEERPAAFHLIAMFLALQLATTFNDVVGLIRDSRLLFRSVHHAPSGNGPPVKPPLPAPAGRKDVPAEE